MNYAVDISYDGPNGARGIDHVAVMEAMGAAGRHVVPPEEIHSALRWAVAISEERRVPALVEVVVERETNASMGVAFDKIDEDEPEEKPLLWHDSCQR